MTKALELLPMPDKPAGAERKLKILVRIREAMS
jgi:hypothetical protein